MYLFKYFRELGSMCAAIDSFIDFIIKIQLLGLFSSITPEIDFDVEYSRHVFTYTCKMNSSNKEFVKLFRCL